VHSTYVQLAIAAASRHKLDPTIVCAIVEQESAWQPWAIRFEPAFFAKYVAPLFARSSPQQIPRLIHAHSHGA
jgi:hypothetical protein